MKILFVVPYTPTLIRTRPYNLLRALAQRGHDLTLATLWETEGERAALTKLAQEGVRVLARPLTRWRVLANALAGVGSAAPLQAHYCWQPELAAAIGRELDEAGPGFDVVHVEHLRGAEYARLAQACLRERRRSTILVWDSVDCISLLFEQAARSSRSRLGRWVARLELPRTHRYEAEMVRDFPHVLATSAKDKAALEALAEGHCRSERPAQVERSTVQVLPNGVDLAYFTPAVEPPASDQVILSGKMSYHANVTAALHLVDDIMPLVWARRPGVPVVIAGSNPPREVKALAGRYAPHVTVTGTVPDLRPYLRAAAVAAAPVAYGAGIQNKVLEALACALPVVVSPQAASALRAQPGRDLLVADSAEAFAAALLNLLEAPGRRRAVGQAGRDYVVSHHQWDAIAGRLEALYAERLPLQEQ